MATKAELLEGVRAEDLPARRVEAGPVKTEVAVGDLVAVFSRDSIREVKIMEVTPKRVMVAYTTEGAWKEALKIHAMYADPGYVASRIAGIARVERKNFDYYSKIANGTSPYNPSERAIEEAKAIVALGLEGHIAGVTARVKAGEEAAKAKALASGPTPTITTKSVKRTEVFEVKA